MNRKAALTVAFISAVLISVAIEVRFTDLAAANMIFFPPVSHIYIMSNGEVYPSNASIRRVGALYTFTGNIADCIIEVQQDNIVIDGAGYTFQGNGYYEGMTLTDRSNVTVKNIEFKNFFTAISLSNASNNTITGNNI